MSSASDVTRLPEPGVRTIWFSPENPHGKRGAGGTANGGRKGSPNVTVHAGETVTLAELPASELGTVRRIWLTIDDRSEEMLHGLRIEAWWDGATEPAISAPLGDFFGQMCGQMAAFESVYFASPEARSFVCTLPMPFRAGCCLTLTSTRDRDAAILYYDVSVTTGETHDESIGYIHAIARYESPTTLRRDYEIVPLIIGRGRFFGVHIGVDVDGGRYGKTWWGEGEVKIYVDGDHEYPSLAGTGTEDYIGTAWGQGRFTGLYSGAPLDNDDSRTYGFYRWHIPDPVYFHERLRVTIQQIGHCFGEGRRWLREESAKHEWHKETHDYTVYAAAPGVVVADLSSDGQTGGVLFERQDSWSSVAFLLLDTPNGTGAGNHAD